MVNKAEAELGKEEKPVMREVQRQRADRKEKEILDVDSINN